MERKEKSLPTYKEMYSWEERVRNLVYWEEQTCQVQIEQKIKILRRREPYCQDYAPVQGRLKAETLSRLSQNVRVLEYIEHSLHDDITVLGLKSFKEFLDHEVATFKELGVVQPLRYESLIARLSDLIAEKDREEEKAKEKALSSKSQEQEPSGLLAPGIAKITIESEGGGQIYAVITKEYCDCGENVQIRVTPEPLTRWR